VGRRWGSAGAHGGGRGRDGGAATARRGRAGARGHRGRGGPARAAPRPSGGLHRPAGGVCGAEPHRTRRFPIPCLPARRRRPAAAVLGGVVQRPGADPAGEWQRRPARGTRAATSPPPPPPPAGFAGAPAPHGAGVRPDRRRPSLLAECQWPPPRHVRQPADAPAARDCGRAAGGRQRCRVWRVLPLRLRPHGAPHCWTGGPPAARRGRGAGAGGAGGGLPRRACACVAPVAVHRPRVRRHRHRHPAAVGPVRGDAVGRNGGAARPAGGRPRGVAQQGGQQGGARTEGEGAVRLAPITPPPPPPRRPPPPPPPPPGGVGPQHPPPPPRRACVRWAASCLPSRTT
jgi:hypothetical protein